MKAPPQAGKAEAMQVRQTYSNAVVAASSASQALRHATASSLVRNLRDRRFDLYRTVWNMKQE